MRFSKWLIILFALPIMSVSYANSSSELTTLLNGVHTMRAEFTQTVLNNHGKAIQQSYGKMALSRPGKFRWEVTKPLPQLIVANDTRLWIFDPDLEQLTIRPLHQAAGESPALLLSQKNATIDKDYTVTTITEKSLTPQQWFKLVPRGADSMLASVRIGFMNKQLNEMRLEDHLGHTTRIQFQHVQTNVNLLASLFTFKKPANVDVIDETRRH